MKLNELIIETAEDDEYDAYIDRFHNMSEDEMLRSVEEDPDTIMYMSNAPKHVQLAAVNKDGAAIMNFIYDLDLDKDKDVIYAAFTNPKFIHQKRAYEDTIKDLYADNALLMNKWLRYGQNIRGG